MLSVVYAWPRMETRSMSVEWVDGSGHEGRPSAFSASPPPHVSPNGRISRGRRVREGVPMHSVPSGNPEPPMTADPHSVQIPHL